MKLLFLVNHGWAWLIAVLRAAGLFGFRWPEPIDGGFHFVLWNGTDQFEQRGNHCSNEGLLLERATAQRSSYDHCPCRIGYHLDGEGALEGRILPLVFCALAGLAHSISLAHLSSERGSSQRQVTYVS